MDDGARQPTRLVSWNGLAVNVPASWDITVRGARHLAMERDFQPMLEIRWQPRSLRHAGNVVAVIDRAFRRQTGRRVREVPLPPPLTAMVAATGARGLCWQDDGRPSGIAWYCEDSNMLIICHLVATPAASCWQQTAEVLATVRCHPGEEVSRQWAIQDFRLVLPAPMRLVDFSLAAGLTLLVFRDRSSRYRFCRLAPADHHLADTDLAHLLDSLQGQVLRASTHTTSTTTTHECWNSPTVGQRFWHRLHRRLPYHWSVIGHDTSANRLLAVLIESNRPIHRRAAQTIWRDYEIVPSQAPRTADQQNGGTCLRGGGGPLGSLAGSG